MIVRTTAHARAGLIGNPSDGYFGKTIAVICRNYAARVTLYESPRLVIVPGERDGFAFDSVDALRDDIRLNGYYGGRRLIKAAIKRFADYCRDNGVPLPPRNFTIEYKTDVPVRVGMAGSSAIITATMRALMAFYGVDIPKPITPAVILSVETDELDIGAGLQDRVAQTYEGCVYMNFDKALLESQGHGEYVPLDPAKLPPLYVAYHDELAEGTEVPHNDIRSRWRRGDKDVHDAMARFAALAAEARDLIQAGKAENIGPLMSENFQLRASLVPISDGNRTLVQIGRDHGAHAKFAGSGGAIIAAYDGDPDRLQRMRAAYQSFGATLFTPQILQTEPQEITP